MKTSFIVIEITALIFCIIIGVLWIKNPSGPYEQYITVFCLIFIATDILRRIKFRKKNVKQSILHIDNKNTMFCYYSDNENEKNGNVSLIFYDIKISNISEEPFTIKDVKIEYSFNNRKYSHISVVLSTIPIFSKSRNKEVESLIVIINDKKICLINWKNLRSEFNKLKILKPKGVISGSAFFILEIKKMDEVKKIKDLRISITDYSNNESVHSIKIMEDWITRGENSYFSPKKC